MHAGGGPRHGDPGPRQAGSRRDGRRGVRTIVVDLGQVAFCDSSGLNLLLQSTDERRSAGHPVPARGLRAQRPAGPGTDRRRRGVLRAPRRRHGARRRG
ncbi:hypothetical protein ACU686_24785 [Yinghuangia aomiensis]